MLLFFTILGSRTDGVCGRIFENQCAKMQKPLVDFWGGTAQFACADYAVENFVKTFKKAQGILTDCQEFLDILTDICTSEMYASNCAVSP